MQIDIRTNAREVARWLDDAHKKQLPFAMALAMTRTAQDVKVEEVSVMRRVFDRPTPYALNALAVHPATKRNLVASVEFREFSAKGTPAKRFMNPEIHGGLRSRKSTERQLGEWIVPARAAKLNAYGNISGPTFVKILSQVGSGSIVPRSKRGGKYFRVNRGTGSPLAPGVWERTGRGKIRPVLLFTRAPGYRKRFPFYETGHRVVQQRFGPQFVRAFETAMRTMRTPR